ncbi:unnamed protein product [Cylicocyclus nassatus]|uniref:ShKT domain-containing protein n=1 Tax=Cylicocyclus nassatus TaxID=53992 RepID=A0AA36M854_CYLNA|nr:unnamed protein product [Cylicocyclus nassatus]
MKFLLFLYILGACLSVLTHAGKIPSGKRYYCKIRECVEYQDWNSNLRPMLYSSIENCRKKCPFRGCGYSRPRKAPTVAIGPIVPIVPIL